MDLEHCIGVHTYTWQKCSHVPCSAITQERYSKKRPSHKAGTFVWSRNLSSLFSCFSGLDLAQEDAVIAALVAKSLAIPGPPCTRV